MEEKVDLRNIKAGDTVHFRCGGSVVVDDVREFYNDENKVWMSFKASSCGNVFEESAETYYNSGAFVDSSICHPFDVVLIEPKSFDWSDVRAGMAFKDAGGSVYHYSGPDLECRSNAIFKMPSGTTYRFLYETVMKRFLTRAPLHDITIKEEGGGCG